MTEPLIGEGFYGGPFPNEPFLRDDSEFIKFGDAPDITLAFDGTQLEFLPATDDTGALNIGDGTTDMDFKVFLGSTSNYALFDVGNVLLNITRSEASQTTERNSISLAETQDSTFLTGSNVTYSGGRGSATLKIDSTVTMAAGGFHNFYSSIATSGAFTSDGNGIVGIKQVVTNTAALTDGEMYGAQIIAKHNHATNSMLAAASLIGLEAWVYNSAAGCAVTQIGVNCGWHNEATGGTYGAGSVIRGIQIFCDNNAGGNDPVESTGLAIWNQAGTIVNAINVVESGSGFTNFATITDGGVCAMSTQTNGGTQSGWIKVVIGTATRYVKLWDTSPS